jgi:D-amino-acid dehydrogenase
MRIAVLGAGVVGVTSAYELVRAGHEVVVVDAAEGAAQGTSFANAGQISPGYATPWAAPGLPLKALKWLTMRRAPLALRPTLDPYMYLWAARLLANCTAARYARNKGAMLRLAHYSRDRLEDLLTQTGVRCDHQRGGTLQLFRSPNQLAAVERDLEILAADGVEFELLDRAGCIAVEPGLEGSSVGIAGGLRLPRDETGDCHQFTVALAQAVAARGGRFEYGASVKQLVWSRDQVTGALTSRGLIEADAFVVALGCRSPTVLRGVGLSAPVYPVKGYSLSAPVADPERAPRSTVMDETYKVAVTRLGESVRVGGIAELSGFSHDLPELRRATLEQSARELFGGAADLGVAHFWTGLRPSTPDGPPIISATRFSNLFVNTGHGTLGWTMAAGSGALIADLVCGRRPEIDTEPFALRRFKWGRA